MSDPITGASGRTYTALSIDNTLGFPQAFPFNFNGQLYQFRMYVNIDGDLLATAAATFTLPASNAFLVVQVDREDPGGISTTIFLRKVTPELEYETDTIALTFPTQVLAKASINQTGDFGSDMEGGIAARWA
jgi:hypothetical protein